MAPKQVCKGGDEAMRVCRGESLGVCPFLTVPHKQTLKASIYLEYLFIFYMTRHKSYNFLKLFKRKKYIIL